MTARRHRGAPRADSSGRSRARARSRPRFEDSDRWLRGRIVAALAAGGELPIEIGAERLERVLAGLERDGLVERGRYGLGTPRLPR